MKVKIGDIVKINCDKLMNSWLSSDENKYMFDLTFEVICVEEKYESCLLMPIDSELKQVNIASETSIEHLFGIEVMEKLTSKFYNICSEDWLIIDKQYYRDEKINELCQ
jgi:hypothetical protein